MFFKVKNGSICITKTDSNALDIFLRKGSCILKNEKWSTQNTIHKDRPLKIGPFKEVKKTLVLNFGVFPQKHFWQIWVPWEISRPFKKIRYTSSLFKEHIKNFNIKATSFY